MKQLKFIAGIFLFLLFGTVSSQYYYFDSGGNTYQQGCSETLDVRINSQNENVRAGRFHLILDPEFVIYPFRSDVSELRSFFNASSNTFMNWSSDASPSWKSGSNNTILQADRSNSQTDYKGENGLYATINFKPQYNESGYSIQFGMEYFSGLDTTETTLSKAGGTELINSAQQNIYRTGIFEVLQEPCTPDNNKPTISNFSISDGATKISYVSGISLKLLDNAGVNGTTKVPYIWKNGIWTGNTENRSNQYGINSGTFVLNVSCTNCDAGSAKRVTITNTNSSFYSNGKSWQDLDLNYDVIVNSGELFDFGVEKKITITGVVYDRAGNFGNININFNKPVAPSLIDDAQNPKANQQYVNLNEAVKLGIKDDWAGVNPNTIKITLNGTNGTEYGPYVFSGSDLNLVPVSGTALTDDFKITISNHEDFPVSGTIRVSWEATDNEGTVGGGNYSFSTRPSCSELQCCDPMEIWLERSGGIYEKITRTGGELYVTGSDLATGYVDGNTGYINCNSLSNGLTLYIRGEQTGNLYVDELNLLGKGVKGIISGNELILSLLVDDITLIADTPYDGQYLNGNNIDFAWHVEGLDSYDWISGYVVEIYSGGELYLTGNINGYNNTGRQQYLPDGEYERDVYAYDEEGNESERSEKNRFIVDNISPELSGQGLIGGLGEDDNCTIQSIFTITGEFTEAVTGVRLSGENVIINNKEGISTDGITYIWEVELTGGTGTVRLITDGITDLAGNHFSGSSDVLVIGNYDANAPVLDEIIHATGFECQTITGSVSVSDGGCSSGNTILYKWNDIEGEFMHSEYSGRAGTGIFVVSVFDSALNRTDGNVNFVWQDSPITFEHESIDLGVLSGFEYTYSINDLINMFGARDGTCGTGTISLAGGNTSGVSVQVNPENVKVNIDVNAEGSGYFEVILSDDEGNEKTGHVDFEIKSRGLRCTIVADRTACGTGKVNLILTGNGKYLSWNNWSNMVETGLLRQEVINQNQKMFTGYIKNEAGETGICFYNTLDSVLDNQGPTLSNNLFTGYQCDTISVVLAPIDTGCAGNTGFRYSWSGGVWTSNNKGNFLENNVKTGTTTVQIVDSLGNLTQNEIVLRWNDMRPSANSFILEAGVGEVDRIEKSDAKEGNCSVDRLTATVLKDGEKGSCVISGKSLTFIPKDFVVSGPDSCTLQVKDPEGNTVDIIVDVRDINKLPSIRLNKPLDGSFFNYGSAVDLSWTVVDPGLAKISGFIYELDSVTGHVSGYTDRTYVSGVVLEPGNYNWKVSMILANTNHKIISTEYKLHVYAAGGPVKDFCPNGDYSNSFYDGTCERQHGSATECVENFEDYSEEQQKAYLYAYLKGITTQCPTTLDGYLYRDHFAKMISVYAMEVVGKVPQYGKSGCDLFTDIADDNKELQDYMKLSCELQLMGLNEDGVTPKTYFDPHSIVTRAEFGTVFSRLIFGDTYNVKNGPEVRHIEGYWYKKHLAALKKYGIMTMVDGDWPKYLERRGRVMIMMDRADSYGLFEGKIPSENGVKALFTQELD